MNYIETVRHFETVRHNYKKSVFPIFTYIVMIMS